MATTFEVLAEPRRREILDLLRTGERPVGDLVERLPVTQNGSGGPTVVGQQALANTGRPDMGTGMLIAAGLAAVTALLVARLLPSRAPVRTRAAQPVANSE